MYKLKTKWKNRSRGKGENFKEGLAGNIRAPGEDIRVSPRFSYCEVIRDIGKSVIKEMEGSGIAVDCGCKEVETLHVDWPFEKFGCAVSGVIEEGRKRDAPLKEGYFTLRKLEPLCMWRQKVNREERLRNRAFGVRGAS